MNVRWMRRATLALGLLVAAAAQAQISEKEAEALMRASGMWQQLANTAPAMRAGFAQSLDAPGSTLPPEARQKLLSAADAAFVPERMQAVARKALSERVRITHVPALQAWFATPDGQRITAAEVADSLRDGSSEAEMKAGLAILQAAPEPRRRLIGRIAEVTRAAEIGSDMMANLIVGTALGMSRVAPAPQPFDEAKLRAQLGEQRPQLQQAVLGIVLTSYARSYQALPDEALDRYASFLASAAGEHYTDVGVGAMEAAMLDAVGRIGRP
jgi:hypothetical protein